MSRKKFFGSLFAGIGGLDLGFERAGLQCKWQVEIDNYANQILKKHWPNVARHDDVTTFPPEKGDWKVEVICAGFPCQDISYAGAGAGLHGERSGLFFEAIRVVRQLRPRVILLENVAALLTRGLDQVLGTLAEIGFDAEWHCIPAAAVGAPHIRDRIFVLGYANSQSKSTLSINDETSWLSKNAAYANSTRLSQWNEQRSNRTSTNAIISRRELERARTTHRRQQWQAEPGVGRVADGISNRVDRLKGLGNAVVPQVAQLIGEHVVRYLDEKKSNITQLSRSLPH